MRLKLVLIASVLAAIIGAGSGIVIIYFAIGPRAFHDPRFITRAPHSFDLVTLLLPLVVALFASLFVYRHTARRRKLQAALTVIFTMVLSVAIYIVTIFVI